MPPVIGQIVKQLEDRGWIEAIGHRETPGRPALYATTKAFLDDLGLASLEQLPALEVGSEPPAFEALQGQLLDAADEAPPEAPAAVEEVAAAEETMAAEEAAVEAPAPSLSLFGDDGTPALPNPDPEDPPPQTQPESA